MPAYKSVFQEVESEIRGKVAQIVKEREAGEAVIPVLQYADIADGSVTPAMISKIKDRRRLRHPPDFRAEQARSLG